MSDKENSGAAFPGGGFNHLDGSPELPGLSMRQYAAIKLKVPDSGVDWLDEMIERSRRDDVAAMAMQGLLSRGLHYATEGINTARRPLDNEDISVHAYDVADAMRKESK